MKLLGNSSIATFFLAKFCKDREK